MELGARVLVAFLASQIVCSAAQEEAEEAACSPGFQVKKYHVDYDGQFLKDQPLLQVVFDDCEGNKDAAFEVSHPDFLIDEDLNLVPRRDVVDSGTVIFIHWLSDHADDMAQVDIIGAPSQSTHTLREILGVGKMTPHRSKRSLLVPPMFVPENQRAPFPRSIGKVRL
ncbi:hypothetical protein AMELA_G00039660 [Ameiurus melas]|uniref:Cadherin prodomain domain-containing protein n=1 Tax=Ameiurus melas TaxID=219545 RepID=A0A7J6B9D7_AMEME|nr:hypothetical protein AMELA_G00039660 [Ameiurus melas]